MREAGYIPAKQCENPRSVTPHQSFQSRSFARTRSKIYSEGVGVLYNPETSSTVHRIMAAMENTDAKTLGRHLLKFVETYRICKSNGTLVVDGNTAVEEGPDVRY
ncbi:hypothetical protein RUND412_006695 [Rhizina undulata]